MHSLRSIVVGAALLLVACAGSPQTHFYVLSPSPAASPAARNAAAPGRVVAVGPVSLPDYLDQPGIVTRAGANRVVVATFHQWAGSLPSMTRYVLIQDLASRLPADRVTAFDSGAADRPALRIAVAIREFDVDASGHAVVAGHWEVFGPTPGAAPSAHDSVARAQAAGSSYDERVAALSQALGALSDAIAATVPGPQPPAEPAEPLP